MLTIAYYFLQVVLCSGMMMGYYWLVLRNKRFHQYNRFYLLAIALLSWIVPLIKISWSKPVVTSEAPQMMQFLSVVADNNSQIEQTISKKGFEWSWEILGTGIYFTVAAILLFGLIRALIRLYDLLKQNSCKSVGDVYLILTHAKGTPFSFFRYIFWNEEIDICSEAGKQILQHELTHVKQKHSFDKLFIQTMLIGGWFNPFFWLLRKEMEMIHEFIADKKAVNEGDTASLAQMLLTAAYPQQQFTLTHSFFFSPIKRRLQMLANTKNPRFSYIRRLTVLPLLGIVVVLFAFRNKEQSESKTLSVASVMENVVGAIAEKMPTADNTQLTTLRNAFLNKTYTVVIDAGHGGSDIGVIGIDGSTTESALNLSLARAIRDLNKNPHINIVLRRDADVFQNVEAIATMANEQHPDLFISLHANQSAQVKTAMGKLSTTGIEIFIPEKIKATDYTGSAQLANYINTSLGSLNQKMLGIKTRSKGIWVLNTVKSPAILIETGFITNKDDLEKLKDPAYQKQMAGSILQGINNYLAELKAAAASVSMSDTVASLQKPFEGSEETYNLTNPDSKKRAELKNGKLPEAPPSIKSAELFGEARDLGMSSETPAMFPGGRQAWDKYLMRNLDLTCVNKNGGPPGKYTVTLSFLIDNTGNVSNINAENDPGYGTKNEAIRIISKGPKWLPAKDRDGNAINSEYRQSVSFIAVDGDRYVVVAEPDKKKYPDTLTWKKVASHAQAQPGKGIPSQASITIPAQFPGGLPAWMKYLDRSVERDVPKNNGGPPGKYTVVLLFDVAVDGTVSNVNAQNDPGYGTKEAAIKLIAKGPKWKPAVSEGKNVPYTHKQSITFIVPELQTN
ncbi:MAG: N-acetylmuramoyl-L-alanine amidase, partial [Sediminibacterium sp.]